MEFLVTMTTQVPEETSQSEIDAVRAREAEHSRGLVADGTLLRLWRPPLKPGEWRTYGLFDAAHGDELETVLAAMPLRIWRTDEVTPLSAHPNDPGRGTVSLLSSSHEYFARLIVTVPEGTAPALADDLFAQEAKRAAELATNGTLLRLWRLPGEGNNLGLWQAENETRLAGVLAALPLAPWLATTTEQLSRHPSDPLTADLPSQT
ncbi:muconolactone delta-isomerase [Planctomonas sp. JC2975]|nr:muconolactone delta-isomerase [Planctomonas sp. JC2975]